MRLTTEQIIALNQTFETLGTLDLPIKVQYKVTRNKSKIKQTIVDFEATRSELVKKFGEKSEDGSQYKVSEACFSDFVKEINELLLTEEEVDLWTLSLDELGDIKVKAQTLQALDPILKHE